MNRKWRSLLSYSALVVILLGCENENEPPKKQVIREKPNYRVAVISQSMEPGITGIIKQSNWDSVLIIPGPGSFLSAVVSKKGGSGDVPRGEKNTIVQLVSDRVEFSRTSFEVAKAMGFTQQNYSGTVWLNGDTVEGNTSEVNIETMVFGYAQPLYFTERLIVAVKVDDPLVEKVFLQVTFTKEDNGEDEDVGGGDSVTPYP